MSDEKRRKGPTHVAICATITAACGGLVEASSVQVSHDAGSAEDGGAPARVDASRDAAPDVVPPPAVDDRCTQTDVAAGVFDPDCVYIQGTLREGDSWRDAVFHLDRPDEYATGLGNSPFAALRATDGRMIFRSSTSSPPANERHSQLYEYQRPYLGGPDEALAAQKRVPGVVCDSPFLGQFWIFPDDGALMYSCGSELFVAGSPELVPMHGYSPLAVSTHRNILAATTYPDVAWVRDGVITKIEGFDTAPAAFRSRPSGAIWVAGSRLGVQGELLELTPDGSKRVLGTYDFGDPADRFGLGPDCGIDTSMAVYCIQWPQGVDVVVRYTFSSPPEIVYDEREHPVKLHSSAVVTAL